MPLKYVNLGCQKFYMYSWVRVNPDKTKINTMIYFIRRNIKYACILSTKLCLDLPEGIYLNRTLWIVLSFISIYRFTTTSWKFTHIRIRYNLFPASIPKSNKNSHIYNYPKILFLYVYRHIWFYIYDILWINEICNNTVSYIWNMFFDVK